MNPLHLLWLHHHSTVIMMMYHHFHWYSQGWHIKDVNQSTMIKSRSLLHRHDDVRVEIDDQQVTLQEHAHFKCHSKVKYSTFISNVILIQFRNECGIYLC